MQRRLCAAKAVDVQHGREFWSFKPLGEVGISWSFRNGNTRRSIYSCQTL
jgi:hypothetical protein